MIYQLLIIAVFPLTIHAMDQKKQLLEMVLPSDSTEEHETSSLSHFTEASSINGNEHAQLAERLEAELLEESTSLEDFMRRGGTLCAKWENYQARDAFFARIDHELKSHKPLEQKFFQRELDQKFALLTSAWQKIEARVGHHKPANVPLVSFTQDTNKDISLTIYKPLIDHMQAHPESARAIMQRIKKEYLYIGHLQEKEQQKETCYENCGIGAGQIIGCGGGAAACAGFIRTAWPFTPICKFCCCAPISKACAVITPLPFSSLSCYCVSTLSMPFLACAGCYLCAWGTYSCSKCCCPKKLECCLNTMHQACFERPREIKPVEETALATLKKSVQLVLAGYQKGLASGQTTAHK